MRDVSRLYVEDFPTLDEQDLKIMLNQAWWVLGNAELNRTGTNPPRFAATIPPGLEVEICLQSTPAHFGGVRWWYTCPYCSSRCGRLYLHEYDIGCRKCLNLHYRCQSIERIERDRNKIKKMRHAIWGETEPEINNLLMTTSAFKRPKGMHRNRFLNMLYKLEELEGDHFAALLPVLKARHRGERMKYKPGE
ncbi:hypothetical protein [Buttiauxella agrestis]|uniref:hypothetical protein n=1 Tax=Buttiauxella agrestis TaxID=82977 RepID=UPI00155F6EE4|nr:hypothetical protein [Buttiauxella agrestis]